MSSSEAKSSARKKPVPDTFGGKVWQEIKEWGATLAVFIPVFFFFSMLAYEQRVIPSESMIPSLRVGDRVAVAKFAYGYSRHSVPWGLGKVLPLGDGRIFSKLPERGDVAVFEHPHYDRVMIKRVVGLPGDEVELRAEQLFLNGDPVETEFLGRLRYIPHDEVRAKTARAYRETVGEHSWVAHQWGTGSRGDTTATFRVPEGHILFFGDNRDNSKDGRDPSGHCPSVNGVIDEAGCPLPLGVSAADASIGFVPVDHLIGRAETVILSTHRCREEAGLDCIEGRVWKGL